MLNWLRRFLVWLGISKPGARREAVEAWLEANLDHITAERVPGSRGEYMQVRRGAVVTLPSWTTLAVDVYEAPVTRMPRTTKFGYTFSFQVAEVDGSTWVLTVGPEQEPEWRQLGDPSRRP